jgi:flagellar protein FlaG
VPADPIVTRVDPTRDREFITEIERAVSFANRNIAPKWLKMQFRIHEDTNALMVSIVNIDTGEVIREIPPERNLDALAKMWELVGILFDERR